MVPFVQISLALWQYTISLSLVKFPNAHCSTSRESDSNLGIIFLASVAAACVRLVPFRRGGGGWIPSAHDSFWVSTMIAFSCAFSSLFLDERPKAARIFRLSAIVWMSIATLLLLYAALFSFLFHKYV